tara:strand:+ start:603 stop:851 length:249 start_codon:yes stop_codon:yes gene_type:complete
MESKNRKLYASFYSTDLPGTRRDDGSIVTFGDFYRKAPLRQVFEYHRTEVDEAYAMRKCRRLYQKRNRAFLRKLASRQRERG